MSDDTSTRDCIRAFFEEAEQTVKDAFGDCVELLRVDMGPKCEAYSVRLNTNHRASSVFSYRHWASHWDQPKPCIEVLYQNGIGVCFSYSPNSGGCKQATESALLCIKQEIAKWPFGRSDRLAASLAKHAQQLKDALGDSIEHLNLTPTSSTEDIIKQLHLITEHLRCLPSSEEYLDAESRFVKRTGK